MACTTMSNISDVNDQVEGDVALEVIEESSDEENDIKETWQVYAQNAGNSTTIPASIIPYSSSPVVGGVQMTNSELHVGNTTTIKGNVIIKQFIHNNSGHVNKGYCNSESEETSNKNHLKKNVVSQTTLHIKTWHKIIFSTVCIIIIGGICAIIYLVRSHNNDGQNGSSSPLNEEHSNGECSQTLLKLYNENIKLVFISIIIAVVGVLMISSSVLTKFAGECGEGEIVAIIEDHEKQTKHIYEESNQDKRFLASDQVLIAPNHLRIVPRQGWLAQPPNGKVDPLRLPAPWVIIAHTASENCYTQDKCQLLVRQIQSLHVDGREWFDIGYNWLVGGDGSAYEGRGWDKVGAHTYGYNNYSIAIAFIGTFTKEAPPERQIEACHKLIAMGVQLGKIAKNYKLFAHRQLTSFASPGDALFRLMFDWPHFVTNVTSVTVPANY